MCCAGVTEHGEWRRQFPIRFRHLQDKKFRRWQWIEYKWRLPKDDVRHESRRVEEETIITGELMPERERAGFLAPIFDNSTTEAETKNRSLAIIRPKNVRFSWRHKSESEIEKERQQYHAAARQGSFFDEELKALEPCPYEFLFRYRTTDGMHENECQDWETAAMFRSFSRRYGEQEALRRMSIVFNEQYPSRGMAFAMGTHSRFPRWLLIGVIRVDECPQLSLFQP